MIPDRDIRAAALLMVCRYKEDAMLEAAQRADQLQEEGDWQGAIHGIASSTALSASPQGI